MSHGGGGHHGGARPKKHHEEEHENHERWAVSYADMMTVLLALFIVLYAISVVDQTKFEKLRESLAIGFGQDAPSMLAGSTGALNGVEKFEITPDLVGENGQESQQMLTPEVELSEETANLLIAAKEYQQLTDIQSQIEEQLAAEGLSQYVSFVVDERGLVIGMVGSEVFFAPDNATLTDKAHTVIGSMSVPLRNQLRQISIEGHANVLPSANYATNWELSAARAVEVLRALVEEGGVSSGQISAVGYGDSRPLIAGTSEDALSRNRRVDIVIKSNAPENIRAMLPDLAAQVANGQITSEQIDEQVTAIEAAQAEAALTQEETP